MGVSNQKISVRLLCAYVDNYLHGRWCNADDRKEDKDDGINRVVNQPNERT